MGLRGVSYFALVCLMFTFYAGDLLAEVDEINIGVLSHRGERSTLLLWSPTAKYLSDVIPDSSFNIVPLPFEEVEFAVKNAEIDFLLVNPGIYINMEVRYRVSRLATLNNLQEGFQYNKFGGVIFTRSDRNDLNHMEDLHDKHFMAVDETSLGGFQMAWKELINVGVDPYKDFAFLEFGGSHDSVVMAVKYAMVDAGTVRTGILERMAAAKTIDAKDFKVINSFERGDFHFVHSTRLYPEWPFSKLKHTTNELAEKVALALLNMPKNHPAARAGLYAGWTIPLEYQPVHELFRQLKLSPYDNRGKFTLLDAINKYWYWLISVCVFLITVSILAIWVMRLNRILEKSKSRLEFQHDLILNSVADGICGVDKQGRSTFVNKAMEEITGWQEEDIIGKSHHEILHHTRADGSDYTSEECPVNLTCKDDKRRFVGDDLFWRKDGSCIPVEYSSTPMLDEQGKSVGAVVVFRDISEQKKAEQQARDHQMELAHVARLSTMGEMASGIAHELNQPLTAIATSAHASIQLIESGKDVSQRLVNVLQRIAGQAERAGDIIYQLRQFVSKEEPKRSLVDVNELVDGVLILLAPELSKVGVKIERKLDLNIPKVLVQPTLIDQVLCNLVKNSIEAMQSSQPGSMEIVLRTDRHNGFVIVSVADTGPGLSHEIRDQIFNPFVTSKRDGMGLGLNISQRIIEAHAGRLYLDSEHGMGTVFRFSLPIGN